MAALFLAILNENINYNLRKISIWKTFLKTFLRRKISVDSSERVFVDLGRVCSQVLI